MAEAAPIAAAPALTGETHADVAIIGGGYAGLWTALALRRREPDIRVTVLEAATCGQGPSGRNGGFVNSFWQHLDSLCEAHGAAAALQLCDLADRSVDSIGRFAREHDIDIHYRQAGHLKVSTSAAQDGTWSAALRACEAHGRGSRMRELDHSELRERCDSPLFRSAASLPRSAAVQPALLALGLRQAALDAGVHLAENSHARRIAPRADGQILIETDRGALVTSDAAILAINAAAAAFPPLRPRLAVTSTHMIITEPVPDVLAEIGWIGGECISTARRYLHYFRTTADGRIAFGWGGGRIAFGGRLGHRVEVDGRIARQLSHDILRFFPGLRGRRIDAAWGGPVDVSPTQLPSIGTLDPAPIHYVCGFTGNGVGPAHLAGETLASLALGADDEYARSALVGPPGVRVPMEPFRYLGGSLVRAALLRRDALEDAGRRVDPATRLLCDLPRLLGMHFGR